MTGDDRVRSTPSGTLSRGLAKNGWDPLLARGAEYSSTAEWVRLCRGASAVVVLHYDGLDSFALRQWAIASALGVPVVRWWIGTDVMNVLQNADRAGLARIAQRFLARQVAVSPHLVDELATVHVSATFLPSLLDMGDVPPRPRRHVNSLLVYLPSDRRAFYGEAVVRKAVEAHPEVEFVVLADETHSLAEYPNVRSLGWVSEMDVVWDQVGGLLRITEHDGMPRMVLDALRRGKHVIYSWPLPGCVLAQTAGEVLVAVQSFRRTTEINTAGIAAARKLLTPDPAEAFARMLEEVIKERAATRRIAALWTALKSTVALQCRQRRRPIPTRRGGAPSGPGRPAGSATG